MGQPPSLCNDCKINLERDHSQITQHSDKQHCEDQILKNVTNQAMITVGCLMLRLDHLIKLLVLEIQENTLR